MSLKGATTWWANQFFQNRMLAHRRVMCIFFKRHLLR